jgi:hypothetical protein
MMKKKKIMARAKQIFGQVKILVAYFQTVIVFMLGGSLTFPTDYQQLMDSFEFVNVDFLAILRGTCFLKDANYYAIFLWNFIMPIVLTIILVIWYFISKPKADPDEPIEEDDSGLTSHGSVQWNLFCMICFFIYPNTSRVMLGMFNCHELQVTPTETKHFLRSDYSIECYEGSYNAYMGIAILGVLIYPIGIPVFFTKVLYGYATVTLDGFVVMANDPGAQRMLMHPIIAERFGFLYDRFRQEYWWYETCEMVRKLMIGSISMFIMPGTPTQVCVTIAFATWFLCQQLYCWPFKTYDDNMLMAVAMVATIVTLFGTLIINAEIDVLDEYGSGVSTGILMGATVALLVMYIIMLVRFQLPFICTWMCPECISQSCLNPYRPGGCWGPPAKQKAPEKEPEDEVEKEEPPPTDDGVGVPMQELPAMGTVGAGAVTAEVVAEVPAAAAPPPAAENQVDDEEMNHHIRIMFDRYDLDDSGTLNTCQEMTQLTTNLAFRLKLPFTGEEIDERVKKLVQDRYSADYDEVMAETAPDPFATLEGDEVWDLAVYSAWFKKEFVQI